ncbi:hypothetical protein I4U23_015305 [Adineta vaga]|nr:hypothetical protein I4U23_015305 [Adineta vaga]
MLLIETVWYVITIAPFAINLLYQSATQTVIKNADWLLDATPNETGWIQKNGMQLRGHTLIWAYDMRLPKWLLQEEALMTPVQAKNH